MLSVDDIKKLKTRFVDELYSLTRTEQQIDLTYIDDTFRPSSVRLPHKVLRLGLGAEIVNAPAEQIVTSNPQAFIECKNKEAGLRISTVINGWIDVLRRQNPQPFKESVKNKLGRGENYIKPTHNENWVTNQIGKDKKGFPIFDRRGLPILFPILDPMVIYGSPAEDEKGIPEQVIVFYERQLEEVIVKYSEWKNPKNHKEKKTVEWFEYWDKDTKYFEADGEVIVHTVNSYGFPPFVRKYSGFGRRSPDGELANLIVSDIKNSRGLIEEICVMRSDISSVMHLSAHKAKLFTSTGKIDEKQIRAIDYGEYSVNIADNLPSDFKVEDIEVEQPTREAFQHTGDIMADLTRRHPYILAGFPMGASGRQQGMADVAAMRRYDTVVENTENEWATAFEMAFKIMKAIPTLLPEGLKKSDLDVVFKCVVKLRAKDPIEEDRLITLGDRLRRLPNPGIDIATFHTEFMGYTKERSTEIIVQMLADMVTIYNPDVANLMGMVAAEESGLERWLEQAKQKGQMAEQQQRGLEQMPPRTTQERMQGEVETPLGREVGTIGTKGARRSSARFTRGM